MATDCCYIPEEPGEQVNIMNGVFDERAAAGPFEVAAPGAPVVPSSREELVVSKMCGEQRAKVRRGHHLLENCEDGRVAQYQANLVHDARRLDLGHHLLHFGQGLRERLLTEDVQTAACSFADERRML